MDERILTLHPEGKQGVRIDREKYETIRSAIEAALARRPGLTFTELTQAVKEAHQADFDGSISWYVTTVKLDLEARGVVERIGKKSPQRLRLAAS